MNRTRGFVNRNRYKSGRAVKKLNKSLYNKGESRREKERTKHG